MESDILSEDECSSELVPSELFTESALGFCALRVTTLLPLPPGDEERLPVPPVPAPDV
jgi:hypothetical protein